MILEIPKPSFTSLYEYLRTTNFDGDDIGDSDWDWLTFISCRKDWEECGDDGYDKFCLLLALNVKMDDHGCAKLADFMWENRDVFDDFFNEHNIEGCRPMDYNDLDPKADTGFYEAYMMPLESLLNGNYCDDDYEFLYNALSAKS